ncbi:MULTISPECIES: DUF4153 domain-containing protein [Nitrospirillum]|uniref:Uncharacterized protein DUF4173 n=1 Tax=Nitrospirillum amazonense TaxID=28077 RepID=A0A560FXQ8_9PROT|nr:DUF4173 domain-containing protein [Nitrospirillum amazonense]MEC4593566.1 DUF4173 domain-containing protein [Nitrospirillum amazonense]TWB26417.1 uncharacterized protein DUF4173 [Nitrospirillum amazonense]
MTDTTPVTTAGAAPGGDAPGLPAPRLSGGIMLAGLATLATALFYDAPLGIALPAFLALLCGGALLLNPPAGGMGRWVTAAVTLVAVLALLVDAVTPLSLLLAIPAIAACLLHLTGRWPFGLEGRVQSVGAMLVLGPWRLGRDSLAALEWGVNHIRRSAIVAAAVRWVLPAGLGLIFCLLFTTANPVLGLWVDRLPLAFLGDIDAGRIVFWMVVLALLWPFVKVTGLAGPVPAPALAGPEEEQDDPVLALLLSPATVVRALALFNALFVLQSAMDVYYLWTGHDLPEGVTYAAYAHQGAYPLVLTALLAALFVLVALERPPVTGTVRRLIVVWIAQNILLVLSAMLRLSAYVAAYSLTGLRVAAFLWMVLVAVGLGLILARMALGRSNRWLVGANLAATVALLYGAAWVNIPALIATYNVGHCREAAGGGPDLDWAYLGRLGPQAIPALDRYIALPLHSRAGAGDASGATVESLRQALAQRFLTRHAGWRSWTARDQGLRDYLAAHPDGIDQTSQP